MMIRTDIYRAFLQPNIGNKKNPITPQHQVASRGSDISQIANEVVRKIEIDGIAQYKLANAIFLKNTSNMSSLSSKVADQITDKVAREVEYKLKK
jgi:hypothetical protein